MTDGSRRSALRLITLPIAGLFFVAACASSGSAGWTYAPLGPTPDASASAAPSPTPGASPDVALTVETTEAAPLVFSPNTLEAPAAAVTQVTYNNNSSLPHNIVFFNGPDNTAPELGRTETVTGPNAPESVTFTSPDAAGDYYFYCEVHGAAMEGTLTITP